MEEPDGFAEFVAARSPALLRLGWLLTADAALAEDLVATALAKAWPRWAGVREPEAYVRKAMVTTATSWWRRKWTAEVPSDHLPDSHSEPDDDPELRHDVAAALARLPRRQRAVVVLRYFADLTETQVADELGITVGTVKSQHAKALANLRDMNELALPQEVS